MYSVSIAHPIEGINTIAFEIANESTEDKQFYVEDMTIQSFLRNIDWTSNCFSWIEARRLTNTNIGHYYVTSDGSAPLNTYVYVFCCLRLTPGTYSNIESVLTEINTHLQKTTETTEKREGITTFVRDLPCSLYNITPDYDTVASYKINGFTVGMIPDISTYVYTTNGYEPTTRIAPAILNPDLRSVWRKGTNDNITISTMNPYIPPIIQLDKANITYSTNYDTFEQQAARYNAAVASSFDQPDALNRDFNTSITNHLGLTPYVLPMDHLFTYNDEPVICYSNGNDYMEYLIDPSKADINTIQSFFINTIASTAGGDRRSSGNPSFWIAPITRSANSQNQHLFKIAPGGLTENGSYKDGDLFAFGEQIIINEDTPPEALLVRNYQIFGDTVDASFRNTISSLLDIIVGEERQLEPTKGQTLTYDITVDSASHTLYMVIWFTGGTAHIRQNINAKIEITEKDTGKVTDRTAIIPGLLLEGTYNIPGFVAQLDPSKPKTKLNVIERFNANLYTPVLAIYTNTAYRDLTGTVLTDNKTLTINQCNITRNAMYNEPISVESNRYASYFQYIVNSSVANENRDHAYMDYHFTFTNAVMFKLDGTNYNANNDASFVYDKVVIFRFGKRETYFAPGDKQVFYSKTGKHGGAALGIGIHDHHRSAIVKGVTITEKNSCILIPTDTMISIFDPNSATGHRVYRKFNLTLYEYNTVDDNYTYTIEMVCTDFCGEHLKDYVISSGNGTPAYTGCSHADSNGYGCSEWSCGGPIKFSVGWDTIKDTTNTMYENVKKTITSRTNKIAEIPIYIAYKETNGKYAYNDLYANKKWCVPYVDYNTCITEIENALTALNINATDRKAYIGKINEKLHVIYPLGPYIDPYKATAYSNTTWDLGVDNKSDHTGSWFGVNGNYAIFNNMESTDSQKALSHYITGSGMDNTSNIPVLSRTIKEMKLKDILTNNLTFKTVRVDSNYQISLMKNNNPDYTNIVPIHNLYRKACATHNACFVLYAMQALAYASIPDYDSSMDTNLLQERSDDIQRDLKPGDIMIGDNIYLMDQNNITLGTVNTVKYYPFFAFSNKLYVYMLSDPDIDQIIESQTLNVRAIRTSLAEIDVSSNYSTVTTVGQPGNVMRFEDATDVPIAFEKDIGTSKNLLELQLPANAISMSPVSSNPLAITLNNTTDIPINNKINKTTMDTSTSSNVASGTISLTELTLSQLKTDLITNTIISTDDISGNIQLTIPEMTGMVSGIISDNTTTGIIDASMNIQERDLNSDFIASFSTGTILGSMAIESFKPLPVIEKKPENPTGTVEKDDGTAVFNEYARGTVTIDSMNIGVSSSIPAGALSGITASVGTVGYQNINGITLRGNAPVPVSINLSGVVGRLDKDGTYVETDRLNYQVSIMPYTIPIHKTIKVKSNSSKYIYITGNLHKYPIWESTHSLIYKAV